MIAREQARCIQEGFSPECVERISLRSSRRAQDGGIMLFGGKSRFAKQVLGEERGVRRRREQGRRSTVDRNVQQSLHTADRSGCPGSRLHCPCPGAPKPP